MLILSITVQSTLIGGNRIKLVFYYWNNLETNNMNNVMATDHSGTLKNETLLKLSTYYSVV